ncbi:bacterial Ig-like domain-containing protein [Candidatus Enterococcus ferrettii]|uniref:Uncharacterized protein n=1 Tax=Candidatus Enterococcus ferrettii TaxID=2815324 RepID=A0ABV0ELA7_9ENTE|nr:bacterial Ig-like domain-containing protein [Enterococcus sp. 665A]MBO1341801.1 bacterial Ig-like domain-containing protein [Enterococcus sp. 665A]
MKKKILTTGLLAILIGGNLINTAVVFAETVPAKAESQESESVLPSTTDSSAAIPEATTTEKVPEPAATTASLTEETTSSSETESSSTPKSAAAPKAASVITDSLLAKGTLLAMDGTEYSQTERTRTLNNTPVRLMLDFVIEDQDYAPGSTYELTLPEHLGFSAGSGTIKNLEATWQVSPETRTLTIQFAQRITDAAFSLELKSYLYTDSQPLVDVVIDGQQKNSYPIDLYETVDPIRYSETKAVMGLNGTVYYNLDRTLAGQETLTLSLTDTPGAVFEKEEQAPLSVYEYDVDIKGNVLPESEHLLSEGSDYTLTSNTLYDTSVEINQLNQQKAYGVRHNFTTGLEAVTDYTYSYNKGYPTTGFGSVKLKRTTAQYGGLSLTAKSSKNQKEVYYRSYDSVMSGSMYNKGDYSLYIHQTPTKMKAGEQIILTSQNGQAFESIQLSANTGAFETVNVDEYFDVKTDGATATVTAKKDSTLRIGMFRVKVPFNGKDIIINVESPLIKGKSFKIVEDTFVQPISILNPNNVETAWGNYTENGAYMSDTTVGVEGSTSAPIKNLEIAIEHPKYLTLRQVPEVSFYYKLGQDYTITPTEKGSIVKFTTPITRSIQFDLGFNYVPDSLAVNVAIPIDKLPVTLKADGYETINTTVTTGRKQYSEMTLQAKENQFLVNPRQDTRENLVVQAKAPEKTDVVFNIYDISNDKEVGVYPQYWYYGLFLKNPMNEQDEGYPEVAYDKENQTYTFDFGNTNKRYIIEWKYANGWSDGPAVAVQGRNKDPLYNDRELTATAQVTNKASTIIEAAQSAVPEVNNLTTTTVKTQNIDDKTKKVVNPTIELFTKGNTNASIDLNSIRVSGVSQESYQVEATATGAKLIFSDYTLTQNIEITYNVISQNAGQVSTAATISSESTEGLNEASRTAETATLNLKFSAGDSEGIVYKTQAEFQVFDSDEKTKAISEVDLKLVDKVTGQTLNFTTDETGSYLFDEIMSGKYDLYVANAPAGYIIPDEYLQGKEIQLVKEKNTILVYLDPVPDFSSVAAKDSTLYTGDSWTAADNFVSATNTAGEEMTLDQLTIEGTVDTAVAGDYPVTYKNGTKSAVAMIHVLDNQEQIAAKDSMIYAGSQWKSEDNFVSAKDKTGAAVPFSQVSAAGSVDTNKPGQYEITYSYNTAQAVAIVTVVADQTSVEVKDSTIHVGDKWTAADNFISATNQAGESVDLDQLTIKGAVDTSKVGSYEVTYQNGAKSATATITVVDEHETIAVKDSTIYVGDAWEAADNFVSASAKDGSSVEFNQVVVAGTVDPEKAGTYKVTYSNGTASAVATIVVKDNLASLSVADSTIYVGEGWQPADNFVSAADRDGQAINFKDVRSKGEVDTNKVGVYEVTYTIAQTGKFSENLLQKLLATEKTVSATAKIKVVEKKKDDEKTDNSTGTKDKDSTNSSDPIGSVDSANTAGPTNTAIRKVTPANSQTLPKTGEKSQTWLYALGIVCIAAAGYLWWRKKTK